MTATVLMVIGAAIVGAAALWRLVRGDGSEPTRWSRAEAATTLLFAVVIVLSRLVGESPWELVFSVASVVLALIALTFVLVGLRTRRAAQRSSHG